MNYWWHQMVCVFWSGGTFELVGMGVVGGVVIGAILTAIKAIRAIPQVWREALAEDRAKRLAKQGIPPSDSHPASPTSEVPPTTDI